MTTEPTAEPTSRSKPGGRPRDPQIDTAVVEATLAVLDESGYHALSVEEVARRAGTTRPAIYRRFSGRARLALAAIAARLDVPESPDTGCTLCDFGEGLFVFLAEFRAIRPDVLSSLFAECATDAELRGQYMRIVFDPPRTAVGAMLDRAIARGNLRPDTDRDQILDLLGSLVYYRALFEERHLSDDDAGRLIETLLRGAAVDYDALVAHSEAMEQHSTTDGGTHNVH
ncbi:MULTISPECIES: TetR/AcrR family transcriptional regulator [Pseudonocardia]|uniref:Bacterial regulatory protein n=2 Tax=Pseudonocardia TaxID=1847 RepID=A0A1Y2MH43_PSEAH|nr:MULTISPECIES: TetR/AcrR family transcriptional regulator [Pseudonocardia]OSY34482.1 Bacterial regulatory protein [Pseudonocardia autotrophica]TDN75507.1 TetR family transcriptional regulator [Pseudonocardia autotrophica]BBF99475.1 TetR family transcriptional regulator [Pseudonocardia autotrophica]GEC29668.1 TetR family transcriptional regulator [Pseudonocardia saturnea]